MNQKTLKIGVIQQAPDLGGAEQYMLSLMKEFKKQNAYIFFTTNNTRFLDLVGTIPHKTKKIPVILDIIGNYRGLIKSISFLPYAFYFYFKLLSEYKKEKIDVIVMSGFSEKMLVTALSKFFNIPVVWIEYGPLETIFKRNFCIPKVMYRLLKDIPYTIIVPSQNTANDLKKQGSVPSITIIPCGVEVPKKIKKNNLFPNWKNNFIIGNVSRLTREKGQDYLIRSAPFLIKKYPFVRFLLVGDGPDKLYYKELIQKLQVEKYFVVTGYVEETASYIEAMDIFVFPTVWPLEGFGLVLVEAMMHKKPVVAFNSGPVKEIVTNEKTGLLVPKGDDEKLREALFSFVQSPQRRKKMGECGYKKALQCFTIEQSSKKVLEVLYEAAIA